MGRLGKKAREDFRGEPMDVEEGSVGVPGTLPLPWDEGEPALHPIPARTAGVPLLPLPPLPHPVVPPSIPSGTAGAPLPAGTAGVSTPAGPASPPLRRSPRLSTASALATAAPTPPPAPLALYSPTLIPTPPVRGGRRAGGLLNPPRADFPHAITQRGRDCSAGRERRDGVGEGSGHG